jgi:serine/threonine protein kinase
MIQQKPDNIGFNAVGILKIFDFGLVKELQDKERTQDGLYKMTGMTGALRYMAPEVGLCRPYNLSADVYSWAMVFWYILALEPPFCLYSHKMINDRVFMLDLRPKIFTSWSPRIVNVMNQAWSKNLRERPTFKEIAVVLKSELTEIDPKHAYLMDDE